MNFRNAALELQLFDKDSSLHQDLKKKKETGENNHLLGKKGNCVSYTNNMLLKNPMINKEWRIC